MRRDDALQLGEDVLRALEAGHGEWPLSLITEVYVFGSVARGALEPHDLDLCVEHDIDDEWTSHAVYSTTYGRDPYVEMRRALRGARRSCQILFNGRRWVDFEMTPLWRRGESFDLAVRRLRAIPQDSDAGRAAREAMLPQFEGLERWMPRTYRHHLHDAVQAGAIALERVTLPDSEVHDREARRALQRRWTETSPLLRSAYAVTAHWEQAGVDPRHTCLHGESDRRKDTPSHGAGFSWRYLRFAPGLLSTPQGMEWIEVAHPTRTQPLECLRIAPLDRKVLAGYRW